MDRFELRQIPLTALFIAFGIVLPPVFHLFGLGVTFLPMFLPVMMGSMLLHWRYAMVLAVGCPLASWFLTGMPPLAPPLLPLVTTELLILALIISVLHVHLHRGVWFTLVVAIIADRLFLYILVTWLARWWQLDPTVFSVAVVVSGIPGIILQLLVIPLTLKLLHQKYPDLVKG